MEEGFLYLKGLEELRKITMINNHYLTDSSLSFLAGYTRDRVTWLHLEGNGSISGAGLLELARMKKLEHLHLERLQEVRGPEEVLEQLRERLPQCEIVWPPYTD